MPKRKIYLDYAATTPLDPQVLKVMLPFLKTKFGNTMSLHSLGQEAKEVLEDSREAVARLMKAKPEEIIFTSSATESNNLALKGIAFANQTSGRHLIVSSIEHACVLESAKWLEKQGFNITYLGVDKEGFVNPDDLEKAITDKTILVSIIHGNNETGTINDLKKLGDVCKKHSVYFHTDACQSYTKTEINVKNQDIDLITLNAHKIHGPKGIGALYIRKGTSIKPWQHGGDHEFGMRAGTEDIPGIVGFAEAVKIAMNKKHIAYMANLRDILIKGVLEIPEVKLNGPIGAKRLCNSANFTFKGIEGEAIGGYLNNKGIASSTGSACSARTLEPSYVLMAIGLSHEQANSSLRLTLSRFTTQEEIDYTLKVLPGVVKSLRKISPFWKE